MDLPYLAIPPGSSAARALLIPHPWDGPSTTLAPNVIVVDAPLMIHPASGELARGWCGWRLAPDGVLYRTATEMTA